jgi:hypothetical protein
VDPDHDGVDALGLFLEASANVRVHGWPLGPAGELRGCTPRVVLTKLNAAERQTASLLEPQCFTHHSVSSLRLLSLKLALCNTEATSNFAGSPQTLRTK